jgi:hypothetical protein
MNLLDESEKKALEAFRLSDNFKIYKFNKEELNKLRIDLTFLNANSLSINSRMYESPSQQAVEFVKNYLLCFPEIRPLIHVLKRLLQVEKLNSCFNGNIFYFIISRRTLFILSLPHHLRFPQNEKNRFHSV